jgi:NADH-quinone oxidoreductase subunit L
MVAAGVYLVARMFPFFAGPGFWDGDFYSGTPLLVVALVGGFTALFAATIAIAQDDIKKVLAYSTISQLGFMMLGIGTGSWTAGLFHLFTHAFFKALLFLGSGSVIHAVHSNDMKEMGGLRAKMPITFATFLIGTLAIAGVPFLFSGFYSKEAVLTQAMAFGLFKGGVLAWLPFVLGTLAAGLTAFYMFRIIFMTFVGEPRDRHRFDHAHESPLSMTAPLMILAVVSVVSAGFIGLGGHWFENRIDGIFEPYGLEMAVMEGEAASHDLVATLGALPAEEGAHGEAHAGAAHEFHGAHERAHTPTMVVSILVALLGIALSWVFFAPGGPMRGYEVKGLLARYRTVLVNLYYVDRAYSKFVVAPIMALRVVCALFDKYVIDGLVNLGGWIGRALARVAGVVDHQGVDGSVRGTGALFLMGGRSLRKVQTGRLPDYIFATVLLLFVIFVGFLFFL